MTIPNPCSSLMMVGSLLDNRVEATSISFVSVEIIELLWLLSTPFLVPLPFSPGGPWAIGGPSTVSTFFVFLNRPDRSRPIQAR